MTHLGAACILGLAAVACGGGDDSGEARTLEPTTESPSDSTTSQPESATTTSPSEEDLAKVVVQLDELPTGYAVDPPDDDSSDDLCGASPTEEVPEEREAEVSYTKGELGPSFVNVVAEYADRATAERFMDRVTSIFGECREYTDPDGTTYTFNELSFPNLGDDTFAVRMEATTVFGPFAADLVYVRVSDRVAVFGNLGLGGIDSGLTEDVANLVVARM